MSSSGVALPTRPLTEIGAVDTLIVVGGEGAHQAMHCPETLALIRARNRMARRLCSVCSGSFILASAGVLDGLAATTHWSRAASFARTFPKVRAEADRIFIQQGRIWTSAGISAGIDLALALSRRIWARRGRARWPGRWWFTTAGQADSRNSPNCWS